MNRTRLTIRAYLRPLPGKTEAQLHAIAAAAGATVFYGADQREAWLRSLRPGQAGWTWRLSWLPVALGGDVLPIVDYARVIADLSRRIGEGTVVILGHDGIDSEDKAAWLQAVADGAASVRSGRVISKREQRRRGKIGARVNQERSALNLLRTSHKNKLGMVRAYWKSDAYPNREARAEAINAELEAAGLLRLGSWQTIWRALRELDE